MKGTPQKKRCGTATNLFFLKIQDSISRLDTLVRCKIVGRHPRLRGACVKSHLCITFQCPTAVPTFNAYSKVFRDQFCSFAHRLHTNHKHYAGLPRGLKVRASVKVSRLQQTAEHQPVKLCRSSCPRRVETSTVTPRACSLHFLHK